MHVFKDSDGVEWVVSITIGTIKRIKAEFEINLMAPEEPRKGCTEVHMKKPVPLVSEIHLDPILAINIIYLIVKQQADSRGITDEMFGESLGGTAAGNAHAAFIAEWRDFFQECGRRDKAAVVEKHAKMVETEMDGTIDTMERGMAVMSTKLQEMKNAVIDHIEKDANTTLSEMFTESPGSSV